MKPLTEWPAVKIPHALVEQADGKWFVELTVGLYLHQCPRGDTISEAMQKAMDYVAANFPERCL